VLGGPEHVGGIHGALWELLVTQHRQQGGVNLHHKLAQHKSRLEIPQEIPGVDCDAKKLRKPKKEE